MKDGMPQIKAVAFENVVRYVCGRSFTCYTDGGEDKSDLARTCHLIGASIIVNGPFTLVLSVHHRRCTTSNESLAPPSRCRAASEDLALEDK